MEVTENLKLSDNRFLRISKALIREVPSFENEYNRQIIHMMESYIKTKGLKIVSPLITFTSGNKEAEIGGLEINRKIIIQLSELLSNCDMPYTCEPLLLIGPCLFARYTGNPQQIDFVYEKMNGYAFENDIELDGSNYTVFVNQDIGNSIIDVFMPLKNGLPENQ
jgi:hypothetical protein